MRDPLISYLRRSRSVTDAEDAYGEVVLRVLLNPPSEDVANPAAWVYGVARRVRRPVPFASIPEDISIPTPQSSEAEKAELRQVLTNVLSELSDAQHALLTQSEADSPRHAALRYRLRQRIVATISPADREALRAYGIPLTDTRKIEIWCPRCGGTKIRTSLPGMDRVAFECSDCQGEELFVAEGNAVSAVQGSPKVAFRRFIGLNERLWTRWNGARSVACPACGARDSLHTMGNEGRLQGRCASCGLRSSSNAWQLTFSSAPGQAFWRSERRIRYESTAREVLLVSLTSDSVLRFARCPKTGCPVSTS